MKKTKIKNQESENLIQRLNEFIKAGHAQIEMLQSQNHEFKKKIRQLSESK